MEEQAEYHTSAGAKRPFTCDKCGIKVGDTVERNEMYYLQLGGFLLWSFHGYCECGNVLHWTPRRQEDRPHVIARPAERGDY